jgi:DNA polymerase delta subunit 1
MVSTSSKMNTITFQHLCTEESIADIFLIGRTLDDRSVAVKITDVRPHFCVKVPENISISVLVDKLKRDGYVYCISSTVLNRERDDKDTVPNMYVPAPDDFIVCEVMKGQDILDFKERGTSTFLKISCKNPWHTKKLAKYLQGGRLKIIERQYYNNGTRPYTCPYIQRKLEDGALLVNEFGWIRRDRFVVFNDHVNFTLQYLIDRNIYSCSFIEVEYLEQETRKETSCDIELHSNCIKQVQVNDMAPWRILSYDIESLPRKLLGKNNKYAFPTADRDPIVTIGAVLQKGNVCTQHVWILRPNEEDKKVERLLPLHEVPDEPCVYSPEVTLVYDFYDELTMIESFIDFIISEDVDFIEGHNINRFDNTYVLGRYKVLMEKDGMHNTKPIIGRLLKVGSEIRKSTFQSNQKGSIEKFKLILPGRVILDSYDIMKDQHNESSYKLDSLAEKYLGTKKIVQDYNDIYPMYHGTIGYENGKGRHDLAVYCVKDSWLVRKMMDKLCKLTVLLQMSNVTGISMKDVIERGQGIRTIALMLRYAKKRTPFPYFIPRVIKEQQYVVRNQFVDDEVITMKQVKVAASPESFEGAVVVEPDTGFYTDAVSCLDFASLYPSIMRALNMSYETLVSRSTVESMNWRQLIGREEAIGVRTVPDFNYTDMKLRTSINPDNPTFVSSTVRKGLLPEILESVLAERKIVKKQMKALNDPSCTMYKVYDGRQLGLKVVANSIYGFTGAINGFLPEKRIASSVTKYGRYMINQTKEKVENHPVWGKQHGCKCIYGDTDSVFVHMPPTLVQGKDEEELMEKAHKKGTEMADYITNIFLPPNELEYEKSYSSFLLLKKKRYAGHKYEPGHPPKLQIKGLEAARRDYAPLLVKTQKKMLNILLLERDKEKAMKYVKEVVSDLMSNKIPLDMLIMSKKLSRPPKDYKAMAAHVNLALRLEKENPEEAPVAGDRVDYVIYCGNSSKTSECACLPSEISSGKYEVDRNYYLNKQLKGPLLRILTKVVNDPAEVFKCNVIFKSRLTTGFMASFLRKRKLPDLDNCSTEEKSKRVLNMMSTMVKCQK